MRNQEQIKGAILWKRYFEFNAKIKADAKHINELIFLRDLKGISNNQSEAEINKQESQKKFEEYTTNLSKYLFCAEKLGFDDVEKIKQQ